MSLNPYFNGIYFLIKGRNVHYALHLKTSLNPYFNGIYFLIIQYKDNVWLATDSVLILILMEYTF